jgi:sulfur carrier protein
VIVVNGEPQPLEGATSVAILVERAGCGPKGVAVAVNDEVVPRSTWDEHEVRDGDRVEILKAAQGG